jgi:hypothetical protein
MGLPADQEQRLLQLRKTVIDLWEAKTQRPWSKATETKVFRFERIRDTKIFISRRPITVTQIRERQMRHDDWEITDSDEYWVDSEKGIIENLVGWWEDLVEVTYDGGYEDDQAPDEILEALVVQAKFLNDRMSDSKVSLATQGFEGGSTSFLNADLHPFFLSVVKSYRQL